MKKTLLSVALTIMATFAFAGHGYYADGGSFVNFNPNGAGFTNYNVGQCGGCGLPGFSGTSLGTNLVSLVLGNIEQNTYENGGDDVLDHGSFYYVIYPTGSRPATPVYTSVLLSNAVYNNGGLGNEKRSMNPGTQLINGLANSTSYTIEVYYQSPVTYNGGSTGHTISPQANGGTNYDAAPTLFTATFTTGTVLAVTNIQLSSEVKNSLVTVSWKVNDETNVTSYIVERAVNANTFAALATFAPQAGKTYTYTDISSIGGLTYYRVKLTYASGQIIYSDIINAAVVKGGSSIAASTSGNNLRVTLKNIAADAYNLTLINNGGQQVYHSQLLHDGTNKTVSVALPAGLPEGIYRIIIQSGKIAYNESFIK